LTLEEVYEVRCKGKSQGDLTKMMNEQLLANENINSDIIYTVVFDQWFYSRGAWLGRYSVSK